MSLFRSKSDPEGNGRRPGGEAAASPDRPVSEVAGESDALAQRLQRRLADLESHPHVFEPSNVPRPGHGGPDAADSSPATVADIVDLNDQLDLLRHQLEEAFAEFEQRIEAAERRAAAAEEAAATAEARATDQADVTTTRVRELAVTAERVSSQLAALTTEIGGDDMSDLRQALDRLKANRAQAADNAAALRKATSSAPEASEPGRRSIRPAPPTPSGSGGSAPKATPAPVQATPPPTPSAATRDKADRTSSTAPPSGSATRSAEGTTPAARPAPPSTRTTPVPTSPAPAAPSAPRSGPGRPDPPAAVDTGRPSTVSGAPAPTTAPSPSDGPAAPLPALTIAAPTASSTTEAEPHGSADASRPAAKSTVLSWPGGREAPPLDVDRSSARGRGRKADVDPDPDRL